MKRKFKHICGGIKGAIVVIFTFILFPFSRLFLWHKKIWIVSEFGYEARDNGFSFFKYMRTKHKDINCYYAITFDSPDFDKVNALGNVIRFGSLKHFIYFCGARYVISSKTQGFCPSYYLSLLRKHFHLWGKYVFLQHGITKDDQKFLYKKASKIDLFICGAKPEYEDIKSRYGYKDNELAYTGFARFDGYYNLKTKREILVMPTWRRYAEGTNFTETDYFKSWSSFINSNDLNNLLKKYEYHLSFYLHPHFKDHIKLFKTNCSNIDILPFDSCDLQEKIKDFNLVTLIGSTYNEKRVEQIFKKYKPDYVYHAAAYKHVPLMEDSPAEAIRTNVIGAYNIAKMADKYGTKKMVLVSTDKAVRPTNVMGATKRFAEMIIQYFSEHSATKYAAVRFGNVLGSNGSVVPLFKKQIEAGGPITLTDKRIIRYFMTVQEAVSLILQCGLFADGGEIFILDMGKPVKILDLAERLIRQYGLIPNVDIHIIETGLRPGEKLYEELLLNVEHQKKTSNSRIYVEEKKLVKPIEKEIEEISEAFDMENEKDVKTLLSKVVDSYTITENK